MLASTSGNSTGRAHAETLPRSDSEIEVDFARHKTKERNKDRKDDNSRSSPPRHKSFHTHVNETIRENSQEDSEGSSIIDLRSQQHEKNSRRSRSLGDGAEEDQNDRSRSHRRSSRKSSSNYNEDSAEFDRMSFHSSLKDQARSTGDVSSSSRRHSRRRSSSRDHFSTNDVLDDAEDDDEEHSGNYSRDDIRTIGDPETAKFRKSSKKKSKNQSMRSEKSSKFQDRLPKEASSPPRSPTFSLRSSLSLLPSSEKRRGLRQQIVVTVSCSLAPLACGFAVAYSFLINPQNLMSGNLMFWGQYIFILGAVIGSFLSGIAVNYGRKVPMFLSMSALCLAWMAVIFSYESWMILLFQAVAGLSTSSTLILSQVYISEISLPIIRGSLSCTPLLALHIGLMGCMLVQQLLDWKYLAVTGASLIGPFLIGAILCMPESPRFLVSRKADDARTILQWLRGFKNDVSEEYRDIYEHYNIDRWSFGKRDWSKASFWKPLMVSCSMMILATMSGISSIVIYGEKMIQRMNFSFPNSSYVILVSILIVGILISSLLIDQVGRKLLLLLSLTIMAASSFALGLFLFLKDLHQVETYFMYQWAAEVFSIILFTLAYGTAVGPIAWVTLGEVYGSRSKWIGVTITSMVFWLSMLLVDIVYYKTSLVIATGGLFWMHCIICVGGYIFMLLFLRELRDHRIDDIEKIYLRKSENLIDTFITKL